MAEYQARLMEMLQTQQASMADVERMSTPEMVQDYIKCAALDSGTWIAEHVQCDAMRAVARAHQRPPAGAP